ncbi:MAG: cytochrome c family protein [Desulfobacterales bacterium]|nr:cytochrome c family protein [Desulfobacterales bacterium]
MDSTRIEMKVLPSLLACLVCLFLLAPGMTQAAAKQRPAVPFPHGMHTEAAECLDCHHDYEGAGGENILDEGDLDDYEDEMMLDSVNNPEPGDVNCIACHSKGGKAKLGSMDAFHNQCITCHETEKAGPVMCGECHVKMAQDFEEEDE